MSNTAKIKCCGCQSEFHIQVEPTFNPNAPLVEKAVDCPICEKKLMVTIREDQVAGIKILLSLHGGSGEEENSLNKASLADKKLFLQQVFPTTPE